jgi:predicted hydrocarbon binding protein
MEIKPKPTHDPVADLHIADAYMRWQLLAAEEVVGKQGLATVLRENGLEKFIDNYPAENFNFDGRITTGEYSALSAALMTFYGRAGRGMTLRIGRLGCKMAIEKQGALFNVAGSLALKLLPVGQQLKLGMENLQSGFRKLGESIGEDYGLSVEDRGETIAYIANACPMCAGQQADAAICTIFTGNLEEGARWLTGHEHQVVETSCRAKGDPACVWEVSKAAKEE